MIKFKRVFRKPSFKLVNRLYKIAKENFQYFSKKSILKSIKKYLFYIVSVDKKIVGFFVLIKNIKI